MPGRDDGKGARRHQYWARNKAVGLGLLVVAATYLNVKFVTDGGKPAAADAQDLNIVRYAVTGDGVLRIWTMSEDAVAAAIDGGVLAGRVEKGRFLTTIKITAGSAELAAFVARSDPTRLFAKRFAEFRRIP